jgi:hypothetical protein
MSSEKSKTVGNSLDSFCSGRESDAVMHTFSTGWQLKRTEDGRPYYTGPDGKSTAMEETVKLAIAEQQRKDRQLTALAVADALHAEQQAMAQSQWALPVRIPSNHRQPLLPPEHATMPMCQNQQLQEPHTSLNRFTAQPGTATLAGEAQTSSRGLLHGSRWNQSEKSANVPLSMLLAAAADGHASTNAPRQLHVNVGKAHELRTPSNSAVAPRSLQKSGQKRKKKTKTKASAASSNPTLKRRKLPMKNTTYNELSESRAGPRTPPLPIDGPGKYACGPTGEDPNFIGGAQSMGMRHVPHIGGSAKTYSLVVAGGNGGNKRRQFGGNKGFGGGEKGSPEEERRFDGEEGPYTFEEFVGYYGEVDGAAAWEVAIIAPTAAAATHTHTHTVAQLKKKQKRARKSAGGNSRLAVHYTVDSMLEEAQPQATGDDTITDPAAAAAAAVDAAVATATAAAVAALTAATATLTAAATATATAATATATAATATAAATKPIVMCGVSSAIGSSLAPIVARWGSTVHDTWGKMFATTLSCPWAGCDFRVPTTKIALMTTHTKQPHVSGALPRTSSSRFPCLLAECHMVFASLDLLESHTKTHPSGGKWSGRSHQVVYSGSLLDLKKVR